jgi:hypothetical protein
MGFPAGRRIMNRLRLFLIFAFCFLFAAPRGFSLREDVILTIVVASSEGSDFNLDNDAYRDKLIELFSYTAYTQLNQEKVELAEGHQTLSLPEGYEVTLSLLDEAENVTRIQVRIDKKDVTYLDTVLSLQKPGVVFLGGPPLDNGDLVLVLETVQ